jgi:hypothetical protein
MKCIQSIRETKNTQVGEIKRLEDKEAQQKVDSGYWKFIPKSEWKLSKGKQVETPKVAHDMGGSYEVKVDKKKKSKNFSK